MQLVTLMLPSSNVASKKLFEHKRIIKPAQLAQFIKSLENESNWEDMYKEKSADVKFNCFHTKFLELYNSHFPMKKVVMRDKNTKEWLTTGIKTTSSNFKLL